MQAALGLEPVSSTHQELLEAGVCSLLVVMNESLGPACEAMGSQLSGHQSVGWMGMISARTAICLFFGGSLQVKVKAPLKAKPW